VRTTQFEPKLSHRPASRGPRDREEPYLPFVRPEKAPRQVGKKLVSVSLAQLRFLEQLGRGHVAPLKNHHTPTHRALERKGCTVDIVGDWELTPRGNEMRGSRGKLWVAL